VEQSFNHGNIQETALDVTALFARAVVANRRRKKLDPFLQQEGVEVHF
jgi:hypothetical protein